MKTLKILILLLLPSALLGQWDTHIVNAVDTTANAKGIAIIDTLYANVITGRSGASSIVIPIDIVISGSSGGLTLTRATADTFRIMGSGGAFLEVEDNNSSVFHIASDGKIGIGTATPSRPLEMVGNDMNIRIKEGALERVVLGNAEASGGSYLSLTDNGNVEDILLRTYADSYVNGNGNFGIGTTTPSATLHLLRSSTALAPSLTMENTADGILAYPFIDLYNNDPTPTDGSIVTGIQFRGEDSAGNGSTIGAIEVQNEDVTDGDEAGEIILKILMDNTARSFLSLDGYNGTVNQGEIILNEDGQDVDTRIEASGALNAFFVEGSSGNVGVGTAAPASALSMGNDKLITRDVNAGITASVTQTQGNGALTAEINEVSTVANVNDTVTLPTAVAGLKIVIINNGANTLQIFPASGDNLGAGVNTATTLASGSNVVYVAYDATNWEVI